MILFKFYNQSALMLVKSTIIKSKINSMIKRNHLKGTFILKWYHYKLFKKKYLTNISFLLMKQTVVAKFFIHLLSHFKYNHIYVVQFFQRFLIWSNLKIKLVLFWETKQESYKNKKQR